MTRLGLFSAGFLVIMTPWSGVAAQLGAITGQIVDPVSLPLARVKIGIMTEDSSGRRYSVQSDKEGYFRVEGIAPGVYSVEANLQGFRKAIVRHVKVREGEAKDLGPVKMELASCGSPDGPICDHVR